MRLRKSNASKKSEMRVRTFRMRLRRANASKTANASAALRMRLSRANASKNRNAPGTGYESGKCPRMRLEAACASSEACECVFKIFLVTVQLQIAKLALFF